MRFPDDVEIGIQNLIVLVGPEGGTVNALAHGYRGAQALQEIFHAWGCKGNDLNRYGPFLSEVSRHFAFVDDDDVAPAVLSQHFLAQKGTAAALDQV